MSNHLPNKNYLKNKMIYFSVLARYYIEKSIYVFSINIKKTIKPIKVSFLIAGAQKSGTSALHFFLNQNPKITMSTVKETNFFSSDKIWKKRNKYSVYHNFFIPNLKTQHYGESSPVYMLKHEKVVPRIAKYNPKMKIILILRNPVERAYSQYNMHRSRYNLDISFKKCLSLHFDDFINDNKLINYFEKYIKDYLEYGNYVEQIKTFYQYFKKEQVLILLNEDLKNNHNKTMKEIAEFLQVPYTKVSKDRIHQYHYSKPLGKEERTLLQNHYEKEILKLEQLIKRDLSAWL